MLAGVVLGISGRLLTEVPAIVEWHRTWFFPRLTAVLQAMSGRATTTIGEVILMMLIAVGAVSLFRFGSRAVAPLVLITGFAVAWFYASWGFAYKYQPLGNRLATLPMASSPEAETAELVAITRRAAELVARSYETTAELKGDDGPALAQVNASLEPGFSRLPATVEAAPVTGVRFGPAKRSRISSFLSRLQISGYFSPWLGEAQIDGEMPRSTWTRVASHERAHQRGFARENEATVIGIIACLSSSDPRTIYAGSVGLFLALDREVSRVDKDARREIWKLLPKGVVDELKKEAAFWAQFNGMASDVSEKVNDTYLKAQGVPSGTQSYSETTRLFLQAIQTPTLPLGTLLSQSEMPKEQRSRPK
ncbi:MAG: DUF3810 family protein [Vicinamibacteria bacterium]